MTQSELSEFLNVPVLYEFKSVSIDEYRYKIWDNNIRPRHFLDANHENGIEAILLERKGHSLHEIIDGDDPLRPFIDFDLLVETLDAITPKLSDGQAKNAVCYAFRDTCLEVFPEWDKETMTIADNSDEHIVLIHIQFEVEMSYLPLRIFYWFLLLPLFYP